MVCSRLQIQDRWDDFCQEPSCKEDSSNREVEQGLVKDAHTEEKTIANVDTSSDICAQEAQQRRPSIASSSTEEPATPSKFSWDHVDVIYADDEELLVDVVKMALVHQGVLADNVHVAKDGLEAMELVLSAQARDWDRPLLLLLDLCMPNMDGHECAARAYEMADKGMLRRPPYVIGCSSHVTSLKPGQFHTVIPKDAFLRRATGSGDGLFSRCLNDFKNWWSDRRANNTTRWNRLNIAAANCLIVDTEPICRMGIRLALQKFGIPSDSVEETDDREEALESFNKILEGPASTATEEPREGATDAAGAIFKPVLVFLGRRMGDLSSTLRDARLKAMEERPQHGNYLYRCEPFIVCASSSFSARAEDYDDFHCCLPKLLKPDDLCWVLQLFKLWWFERDVAAEKRARQRAYGITSQSPRYTEDLGAQMQAWRSRRQNKRKARVQSSSGDSYGVECRRLARSRKDSPNSLREALAERWPEMCSCSFEKSLGSGSQADVFIGTWGASPAAIKVIHAQAGDKLKFRREIEIGKSLHHPNLVFIYDGMAEPPMMIFQEYCAGGSVHQLLQKKVPTLTLAQRLKIALDVAKGMSALHGMSPAIVHRDLKSENVLLVSPLDDSNVVPAAKVADFGLARFLPPARTGPEKYMTGHAGTPRWMAPEVMSNGEYGLSADVFSYGVFMFELFTCIVPYSENPGLTGVCAADFQQFVCNGGRPDDAIMGRQTIAALEAVPSWASVLMHSAWAEDPNERPTFNDIIDTLSARGMDPDENRVET
mmetsp:Transcript_73620/g.140017  ORF Transcript_73620/g.140017 Transcript_73620/m.140017 type:complete len:770 (+) Transcript_73620:54-2363(+)